MMLLYKVGDVGRAGGHASSSSRVDFSSAVDTGGAGGRDPAGPVASPLAAFSDEDNSPGSHDRRPWSPRVGARGPGATAVAEPATPPKSV